MRRYISVIAVVAAVAVAAVVALRAGSPPDEPTHPELDALLAQCDPGGTTLATMYAAVANSPRAYVTTDPARALTMVRGQVANVIDGRLAVCERAMAIAQHDKRGSAVMALGPFVERLKIAHAALGELVGALEAGGGSATARFDALDGVMR